jgi:hypothetical protein
MRALIIGLLLMPNFNYALSEQNKKLSMCIYTVYKIPDYLPIKNTSYQDIYRAEDKTYLVDLQKRYVECKHCIVQNICELFVYSFIFLMFIGNIFYPMF